MRSNFLLKNSRRRTFCLIREFISSEKISEIFVISVFLLCRGERCENFEEVVGSQVAANSREQSSICGHVEDQ